MRARQTALAMRLYEAHRNVGDSFWHELDDADKDAWHRVARHIEARSCAPDVERLSQ